ncbi:MAG: fumarate hydratase [Crenarchaeota archaeon]|nr:fumarate hydratase [Thermoproteota archaeon]
MLLAEKDLKEELKKMIYRAQTELPEDVYRALIEIRSNYKLTTIGEKVLECMIENVELAKKLGRPICQDTGTHIFIIRGTEVKISKEILNIFREAVKEATFEIPLRPNAVDPVTNKNTGTGVGRGVPDIDVEIVEEDKNMLEIYYIPKGGGCELPCRAFTVPPSIGFESLKKAVIGIVSSLGRYSCPPLIVGVGIGATIHAATRNAMKALYLRKIGERSDHEKIANIEEELVESCNKLNVGIQGIGEGPTVLDVHIEYTCRHPATFSIAIITSCWVLRRSVLRLS